MSDNKAKRKFYQSFKPDFVNINEVTTDGASSIVPVFEQLDTINAISGYNKTLPARRKAKGESLPEIPTSNVIARTRMVKEIKKKEIKTVESVSFH